MNCPNCSNGTLITESTDCRQEWANECMTCDECEREYTLKTVYKTQSSIIHSQELVDEETGEIVG